MINWERRRDRIRWSAIHRHRQSGTTPAHISFYLWLHRSLGVPLLDSMTHLQITQRTLLLRSASTSGMVQTVILWRERSCWRTKQHSSESTSQFYHREEGPSTFRHSQSAEFQLNSACVPFLESHRSSRVSSTREWHFLAITEHSSSKAVPPTNS